MKLTEKEIEARIFGIVNVFGQLLKEFTEALNTNDGATTFGFQSNILINTLGQMTLGYVDESKGYPAFVHVIDKQKEVISEWFDHALKIKREEYQREEKREDYAMNELAKSDFSYQITSLDQAMKYAEMIAGSDLAPKDYKGKPGNCLIAMQFGSEIGLKPLQAIQNIAVINGRPSLWGDAMIALVQSHPLCEYIQEAYENGTASCTVKRRGDDKEYTYTFSKEDAKLAGLLSKPGCWSQYPERMLQMRARGFALRDKFSDVLKGIAMREEVQDYVVELSPENNKKAATERLDQLLEAKNTPKVIYEDVHCLMSDAQSIEELDTASLLAKNLSDVDKEKARVLYKTKYRSFIDAQIGEILKDDKKA